MDINPVATRINGIAIIPIRTTKLFHFSCNKPENDFPLSGKFSNNFADKIPTMVAQNEPNNDVPIMIAGCELPAVARNAIAVAGINVMPAVLIARNVHIAFVAVPFSLFNVSNSSIAFKPNGVAALPNPRILAEIFITIEPIAG